MIEAIKRPIHPEVEKLDRNGELERYLLSLVNGNIIRYRELSPHLISTGIEQYANWFTDTETVTNGFDELGSYIHIWKNPLGLVISSRPEVGINEVMPPFARKRDKAEPVALVHSHQHIGCFSQPPGHDINAFINGYEDKGEIIKVPVWVLATPTDNFLLLKTDETIEQDDWELYSLSYNSVNYEEFLQFQRYGVPTAKSIVGRDFFKLLERAEETFFGCEFQLVYKSYFGTLAIAEACKLGFYHSSKDGIYQKTTRDSLNELVNMRYEAALQKALKL